jgi:hypothetical protein
MLMQFSRECIEQRLIIWNPLLERGSCSGNQSQIAANDSCKRAVLKLPTAAGVFPDKIYSA